jgi:hypothetical protein
MFTKIRRKNSTDYVDMTSGERDIEEEKTKQRELFNLSGRKLILFLIFN